jgi:O-antigen/teichoic acid export membrane protein
MGILKKMVAVLFKNAEDRKRLYKVVVPSFVIHFFAGLFMLALVFVMTRGLGSRQYGIFTYCFSIVFIVVSLITYGINVMAVRETPSLLSTGKTVLWKGLHTWSFKLILVLSIVFPLLIIGFLTISTFYLHLFKETVYTVPLIFALTAVPFYATMSYFSNSLRGQHRTVLAFLPDNIVKPVLFLLCMGISFAFLSELHLRIVILLNVLAFMGAAAFAMIVFYRTTSLKGIKAEYDIKLWKKSLQSFFLLTVVISINSKMDILMLGYLKDSSQVGIYSVADRIGTSLMIFLAIMNQSSAASISRMHTLEQKQKLQEMITKISRGVMIISLPVFACIVIFSKWIMSYFGADFASGQTALIIIASGQLISIAYGPVGTMALMTGNQRYSIIYTFINILINFILNIILTPSLGITGTAIATTCAIITWNTGMFLSTKKKTGIRTWLLG